MAEIDHKAKFDICDLCKQGSSALTFFTEYINSNCPVIKLELVYLPSKLYVLNATLRL